MALVFDERRVQELLDEMLDSGRTPDEVCADTPELFAELDRRWQKIRSLAAQIDELFPEPETIRSPQPAGHVGPGGSLPHIPNYEVEAVLGQGGMGIVFRARQLRLNRLVALKMALAGAYAGPKERERFQREAEAVAALRHANIVQIYDVGDADGQPYFTMELVDGDCLARKLAGAPQPPRRAAALMSTLAGAIHVAHQSGIIHRDLKPANILFTSDGTPKISDFGLARRLGVEAAITRTGALVGTPSYMAPEQARGTSEAVGPAADIYALGAILYELMTGRPPFHSESSAATVHQLLTQDPVPPSRLNGKNPRDLETICLTCLHKEARLRYASAKDLANDLDRFNAGEAIAARPEGPLGRLARRVRSRPVGSAAILAITLLTLGLVAGGLWLLADRAIVARAADQDLNETDELLRKFSWSEAHAALERARGRLGSRPPARFAKQLERGALWLDLSARLESIRLDGYAVQPDGLNFRRSDGEYEAAFHGAGLSTPGETDPATAAAEIAESPIAPVLIAALDHWAACYLENPDRKAWLLETIRLADVDSTGWRAQVRRGAIWNDDAALGKLIDTVPAGYPSLPVLLLIEERMTANAKDSLPFLRRVQRAYPGDFWVNARLARSLYAREPAEAVRYYQAALAIRPGAMMLRNDHGLALARSGRREEALAQFRLAVDRDPTFPPTQTNLCVLLSRLGRHDEAIEQVQAALLHHVRTFSLYTAFGHSLAAKGRIDEALAALRQAVALDPKDLAAQSALRGVLMRHGQLEKARDAWEEAIAAEPIEHDAYDGYAELCLFLGKEKEYRLARQKLLGRFERKTDPQVLERTGRACLLGPGTPEEIARAAALIDGALAADKAKSPTWIRPYFLFAKAMAEYRLNRFESAKSILEGEAQTVLTPGPQILLAMAQHRLGQNDAARKTLASAMTSFDWHLSKADNREAWIFHVLRREAEQMIHANSTGSQGVKQ